MSGCQRCLECGCLAVSDVLCADVWLSAMSCVRMSGCQRCLVCGCLAVIDVLSIHVGFLKSVTSFDHPDWSSLHRQGWHNGGGV